MGRPDPIWRDSPPPALPPAGGSCGPLPLSLKGLHQPRRYTWDLTVFFFQAGFATWSWPEGPSLASIRRRTSLSSAAACFCSFAAAARSSSARRFFELIRAYNKNRGFWKTKIFTIILCNLRLPVLRNHLRLFAAKARRGWRRRSCLYPPPSSPFLYPHLHSCWIFWEIWEKEKQQLAM